METVDCNLCGSSELVLAYRQPDVTYFPDEWFSTVRCGRCGLGFVNPRPTRDEIARYYPASFYEYFSVTANREFHAKRYATEARTVHEHLTNQGRSKRLLDVGCANGDFPRFMRGMGWDVEGVEVSANARTIDDFNVYRREFPDIPDRAGPYDAVTAWAVLEHVHDPMAYFRKAARVLLPGGVFVFLVTNFESLSSSRLFGEDIPRHLYFFTQKAVRSYLETTGFDMVDVEYSDRIYAMLPVGALRFLLHRWAGRPFTWEDSRLTDARYLQDRGLPLTRLNRLKFAARHPLSVADRVFAPFYARYEMLAGRYGIATYVGRRREVA